MNETGEFNILQLTDLHIGSVPFHEQDYETFAHIKEMTERANPDLVVITGDLIWSEGVPNPKASFEKVIEVLNELHKPIAITYGNHDTEEGITRSTLRSMEEKIDNLVKKKHLHIVEDRESYCVEISGKDGSVEKVLYFIDSGSIDPLQIGTYEYIHPDQVTWFNRVSKKYEARKSEEKQDLLFFHIPLPEYKDAWIEGKAYGHRKEEVSSPVVNTGLFTSLLMNGRVEGVFCGHDHDNDFIAAYHGIQLGYGRISGYHCYGELDRGARIIQLYRDRPMETSVIETNKISKTTSK